MTSFYFRYEKSDHHIAALRAQPHEPFQGRISINFQDRNGDDRYFYNIVHKQYFGAIFARSYGREVCKGSCTRTIAAPANRDDWVFVIKGFYVYFRGTDHHIDQLQVMENDGQLTVSFNDKNNDDTFFWEIDYAYIPRDQVSQVGARSGRDRGATRVTIPNGTALLRGFNFNFRSKDHHIKEVGAWMPGDGRLEVYYADKNGDDSFDWQIRYAILP